MSAKNPPTALTGANLDTPFRSFPPPGTIDPTAAASLISPGSRPSLVPNRLAIPCLPVSTAPSVAPPAATYPTGPPPRAPTI